MPAAPVDLELLQLLAAELGLGKHSADRGFDHPLGSLCRHLPGRDRLEASRVARMPMVDLFLTFTSRQKNLLRVDHNDEVPGVEVGHVMGVLLAGKEGSGPGSQTAEDLTGRVHDEPVVANLARAQRRCARAHIGNGLLLIGPFPGQTHPECSERARKNTQAKGMCQWVAGSGSRAAENTGFRKPSWPKRAPREASEEKDPGGA